MFVLMETESWLGTANRTMIHIVIWERFHLCTLKDQIKHSILKQNQYKNQHVNTGTLNHFTKNFPSFNKLLKNYLK